MAINFAYLFSSRTFTCRIIKQSGTTGPAAPCKIRPIIKIPTFVANPEIRQPIIVKVSIPIRTFFRPIKSAKRGKNRANKAAAVKKMVCVSAIDEAVVCNWVCMVTKAGESIEALS